MFPLHDDNPTEITPVVTIALIAACAAVFFWQLSLGPQGKTAVFALGVIPAVLLDFVAINPDVALVPAWATVFTSMFMHGGWMHIIGNMLFLWIFGNNIEDAMGHARFILFYLCCGVAAVFAQVIPDPQSTIPMVGASGAISGVLGGYLLLYPKAKVLMAIPIGFFITTMRLPAALVLVFWFGMQLLSSFMAGDQQGGVAFGAHIGGFIAGMLLIPLFKDKHLPIRLPWS